MITHKKANRHELCQAGFVSFVPLLRLARSLAGHAIQDMDGFKTGRKKSSASTVRTYPPLHSFLAPFFPLIAKEVQYRHVRPSRPFSLVSLSFTDDILRQ
jgi:hypothetical protein